MSHLVKTSKRIRYEKSPVGGAITDPKVFFNRRAILKTLGSAALVGPYAAACGTNADAAEMLEIPYSRPDVFPATRNEAYQVPGMIERKELTAREVAGSHNNFYEFLAGARRRGLEARRRLPAAALGRRGDGRVQQAAHLRSRRPPEIRA